MAPWQLPAIFTRVDSVLPPDLAFCKGCGICANECTKRAIAMVREEK